MAIQLRFPASVSDSMAWMPRKAGNVAPLTARNTDAARRRPLRSISGLPHPGRHAASSLSEIATDGWSQTATGRMAYRSPPGWSEMAGRWTGRDTATESSLTPRLRPRRRRWASGAARSTNLVRQGRGGPSGRLVVERRLIYVPVPQQLYCPCTQMTRRLPRVCRA